MYIGVIMSEFSRNIFTVDPTVEATSELAQNENTTQNNRKRKRESQEDELDPFNLSNDQYYRVGAQNKGPKQKLSKTRVIHSEPALKLSLNKSYLTNNDWENFHRPKNHIMVRCHVDVIMTS